MGGVRGGVVLKTAPTTTLLKKKKKKKQKPTACFDHSVLKGEGTLKRLTLLAP